MTKLLIYCFTLASIAASNKGNVPMPLIEICDNGIDDDNDGLIDINDPDCKCSGIKDSVFIPTSLVPNPWFENYIRCPDGMAQLDRCIGWIQASDATSDFYHLCGIYKDDPLRGMPPQPLPAGKGYVGFLDIQNSPGRGIYKEYVGACLTSPMIAGKEYTLSFWIGFGKAGQAFKPRATFNMGIFGTSDCQNLPFGAGPTSNNDFLCPTKYPGWFEMSRVTVSGKNQWKKVVVKLRPTVNVSAISLGPACATTDGSYYFWMDELILEETVKFDSLKIDILGNPCLDTIVLKSSKSSLAAVKYQWYKNGVAIIGATKSTYVIPKASLGTYIMRASFGNQCELSKPFTYTIDQFITKIESSICEGSFVEVANKKYLIAGTYLDTLFSQGGCDSILEITVKSYLNYVQNIKGSICKESPYSFDGTLLDSSGSYTFNYYTINGCDSIIIIDLTVLKNNISNLNYQICSGDQIIVSGKTYSIPGFYSDTLKNVNNCDSILEINIIENENFISLIDTSICSGSFINIGKKNYFASGTYVDTLSTKFLCDSIVNLKLTVHNSNFAKLDTSICEGNSVNISGIKYQTNGIFSVANKNVFGCDSTIELDLKVNKIYSMTTSPSICEGDFFEIANQKYTKSGQYNISLKTQQGCDSSIQLNLLVLPVKKVVLDTTICFNQKLVIANKNIDSSGVYNYVEKSINGCDSLVSIKLKINSALVINDVKQTLKCLGDQNAKIEVKSSGGQMPYQYRWSNGEKSSLLKDLKAGTYTVTVSDQLGCPLIKTFEIIEPECFCFEVLTSSGSCLDMLPNRIDIQQKSGRVPFDYLLNSSSIKPTNNSFVGVTNGHYSLEILDSLGCTYSKEMDLLFDNSYIQDLGVDTVYATVGDSILLKTNNTVPNVFVNNSWARSGILICSNCIGEKIQAEVGTIEYTYEGIDENGCEIEYKLFIIAKQNFNVPNVFSPNGDNVNDYFNLYSDSSIDQIDLIQIYSRWGERIFESRGAKANTQMGAWNGTIDGLPAIPGVYVYLIIFKDKLGKSYKLSGDVTLLR